MSNEQRQDCRPRVDVALVHYPVVNRNGGVIGSAITNLDLHDIARACATYGCTTYWVVTPFREQQELAGEIVAHWTQGYGGQVNPDRRQALSGIAVRATLEETVAGAEAIHGSRPFILATCARQQERTVSWTQARARIAQGQPVLLLLGTAWGLSSDVLAGVDGVLPPIRGATGFNHLSVRSAASIMLDRLLGQADT